jgi:hypothetical protein
LRVPKQALTSVVKVLDTGAQNTCVWGKKSLFNKWSLGPVDSHRQRNEITFYYTQKLTQNGSKT